MSPSVAYVEWIHSLSENIEGRESFVLLWTISQSCVTCLQQTQAIPQKKTNQALDLTSNLSPRRAKVLS